MISLIRLLTRIKFGKNDDDLDKAAERQFLFPVIGALIGFILMISAWFLYEFAIDYIGVLLVAIFLGIFLYFITGIIHIEGLADFCDGIMASGDRDRKRSAMKDVSLGAGGTFSMIIDIVLLIALLSLLDGQGSMRVAWIWGNELPLVFGIVLAEISGKLAMITTMKIGPSSHPGMGSTFVGSSNPGRYFLGFALALMISVIFAGIYGLTVIAGAISGLFVAMIARRHFGGVSGDSFGASNEIGRIATLALWVIIL